MIVLDTSVVSEVMRAEPDASVRSWLNGQTAATLYLTSISLAELRFGIERLPDGRRKLALWEMLDFTLSRLFGPRLLPFDKAAAEAAGRIAAQVEANGTRIGVADGQIAAIAVDRGFVVATRDWRPFQAAGVGVIDPWAHNRS